MSASRILCVEDNHQMASLLKTSLERFGFEVVLAPNGNEALSLYVASRGCFGTIITDNEMPELTGLDFVRSIRKLGFEGRIVVMSGNLKPKELNAFGKLGINDFFHKPFDIRTLAALLTPIPRSRPT